jgi:hypothetical protein
MSPSGEDKRSKRTSGEGARSEKRAPRRSAMAAQAPSGQDSGERGVLSSLPSRRPQRPSARRAAARSAAARSAAAKGTASVARTESTKRAASAERTSTAAPRSNDAGATTKHADPAARARARGRTRARRATERTTIPPAPPQIPRQGFETEEEISPGSTVNPPSRPELAAAVADLLGELAQGGLTAGGRLLKDVLGRLPGV